MIEIFFLGVGATYPIKEDGMPCIAIRRSGRIFLFDCGENCQVEYFKSKLGVNKPLIIFITHMHGDHFLGIAPLLQTFSLQRRKRELIIYGPLGIRQHLWNTINVNALGFPVKINEILHEGMLIEEKEYYIEAINAIHNIEAYSFIFTERDKLGKFNVEKAKKLGIPEGPLRKRLKEGKSIIINNKIIYPEDVLGPPIKGIKISYSGDTKINEKFANKAYESDILIHEATFSEKDQEEARLTGHSTSRDAAITALEASAKLLFIVHISARYKEKNILLMEAKNIFRRTYLAYKNMKLTIYKNRFLEVIID